MPMFRGCVTRTRPEVALVEVQASDWNEATNKLREMAEEGRLFFEQSSKPSDDYYYDVEPA